MRRYVLVEEGSISWVGEITRTGRERRFAPLVSLLSKELPNNEAFSRSFDARHVAADLGLSLSTI
jgi:hypothetical protein